jgi:hypothetical protein
VLNNLAQYRLLLGSKATCIQDVIDILKDTGKALSPVKPISACLVVITRTLLFRDCLELARSINELPPDVVCKLEDSDKVANAETKAHRGVKQCCYYSRTCKLRKMC